MRILVPSAGAASSISVIKEAMFREHYVLATDLNRHAAGMYLAHDYQVSGMCYEEPYVNDIIAMCQKYRVNHIIPINDAELPIYVQDRAVFEQADIALLMNPDKCVLDGHSKERSWKVCETAGIRQPLRYFNGQCKHDWLYTRLEAQMPTESCFPIIAKPPIGVGGRGQIICCSPKEVRRLLSSTAITGLSGYIWQEYISGEEYSVDCWGDPNTEQFVAVPRTRGKIINGQATGGVTRYDPEVVEFVREICKAFGSNNVCCVQVMRRTSDKALHFIEFNPRYGTGVSLSFRAGIDFLHLQFRQAHGRDISEEMLTYEAGIGMTRYWKEQFYSCEKELQTCRPRKITLTTGIPKV